MTRLISPAVEHRVKLGTETLNVLQLLLADFVDVVAFDQCVSGDGGDAGQD